MTFKIKVKLTIVSLILFGGIFLLWMGFQPVQENKLTTFPVSSPMATVSAVPTQHKFLVVKVVDGDTIELASGQRVRYIGIDTPETVDPRRPVGCFGKEASFENKRLVEGKEVVLEKDISDTDKYGRLLRYVYLPLPDDQLLLVNDYLVRAGFAKVSTYPPDVKFNEQFLEAQREARQKKLGLWQSCPP